MSNAGILSKRNHISSNRFHHHHSSYLGPGQRYKISRVRSSSGTLNTRGRKNLRFSTKIILYLGNGTQQAHGYYGSVVESHRYLLDPITLNDLERPKARANFPRRTSTYARAA